MRKSILVLMTLALVVSALVACTGGAPTVEIPKRPNVLRVVTGVGDVATLDPGVAQDATSIEIIEDCFVGLTRLDEVTTDLDPGMATSWDISADGKTYTFHLRNDVPWVKWDGKEVVKVQDCEGKDRIVNAHDFEYGIIRALKPETASPYAYVLYFVIEGGRDLYDGKTTDAATVGVKALDDWTLEVKFKDAAAYNLNIIGLWTAMPAPRWLIDGDDCTTAQGEQWIEPGFFQGYGPFTLKEWVHDSTLTMIRNPFWPGSEWVPQAKVDAVIFNMIDWVPGMAEFEAGNLDFHQRVPLADMDRVKSDPRLSKLYAVSPRLCTEYYGFNTSQKFVDDVRLRRALSMAIDRASLIKNVTKGDQEVAQWFARPGLMAAPTMKDHPDLGIKFNVAEAKKYLDEYLKEKGLTVERLDITLMFPTSSAHQATAEFIQQQWKDNLGLNVKLTNQEFSVFLDTTLTKDAPQIFRKAWCLDYPDANNFTREVMALGGSDNPQQNGEPAGGLMWKNDKFEELVAQAAVEQDPAKRVELYAQAEQILVFEDAAIIPLYWHTNNELTQPWVKRTVSSGGHQRYEKWAVMQDQ